jgi:hypothetical protein
MEYTDRFRARMLRRMLGRKVITATAMAEETGLSQPTLSRWLRETASVQAMSTRDRPPSRGAPPPAPAGKRAQDWREAAAPRFMSWIIPSKVRLFEPKRPQETGPC